MPLFMDVHRFEGETPSDEALRRLKTLTGSVT